MLCTLLDGRRKRKIDEILDLTNLTCVFKLPYVTNKDTLAQAMRAVLTRMVTSGRRRSPSKLKSNKECMKSTFSASVAEQRRARAHL